MARYRIQTIDTIQGRPDMSDPRELPAYPIASLMGDVRALIEAARRYPLSTADLHDIAQVRDALTRIVEARNAA